MNGASALPSLPDGYRALLVDTGMISPGDMNLLTFVDSADEAWEALAAEYGFDAPPTATGDLAVDI